MDIAICGALALLETTISVFLLGGLDKIRHDVSKTTVVFFLVQYLAVKFYRVFLYHRYFSPLRHLPGPSDNHFFFGQAINLLRAETPTSLYIKWMKEYPDAPLIRYLTFANTEVLVCNNLGSHQELLQTKCYSFHKPDRWLQMVETLIGKGVLSMEGDAHRAARKMLAGPFSMSNIRKLEPVFQAKANDISDLFDRAIYVGEDGKTGVIDCTDTFSKATLDIVGATTLGVDLANVKSTTFSEQASKDHKSSSEATEYSFHQAYCVTFAQNQVGKMLLFASAYVPTRWIPIQENRDFHFATNWLTETFGWMIRDRYRQVIEAMSAGKYDYNKSRDLLTFLVEEGISSGLSEELAEKEFVGQLLQFMAAGHDTSANALSWGVYIMATRKDIQSKLREEIEALVAEVPAPTYNEIDKLPYLDHFIKETLRVFPPPTTLHRQAMENMTIQGIMIPKGTTFDIVPAMPQRNPRIWGPDADEIDPTRWERLVGEQLSPYAFEAFSNGPRICVGRQFAYLEMKTIFAEIIRKYRFLSAEKPFRVENPSLTLRPNGMEVRLEKVSQE